MTMDLLASTRELRGRAWEQLQSIPDFRAFMALEEAVIRMGGTPMIRVEDEAAPMMAHARRAVEAAARRVADGKKLSHGDAAEMVLLERRVPMVINQLLEAVRDKGAEVGGNDPIANFRSTMSRDERFMPIRRDGSHFWWLRGQGLPPSSVDENEFTFADSRNAGE